MRYFINNHQSDSLVRVYYDPDGKNYEVEEKEMIKESKILLEAFDAIEARKNGEWDNPALIKIGPLSTIAADTKRILDDAIQKIRKIKDGKAR